MSTARLPSRYRSLVEQEKDRLVRDIMGRPDWHVTEDDDPEREVVIRVSVERKQVRRPIRSKGVSRFPHRRDYPYQDWIRAQDCAVGFGCGGIGDRWKIEPAHLKTQGSGGDDRNNIVPLCPKHHDEQEGKTKSFEAMYGLDLTNLARVLTEEYEREVAAEQRKLEDEKFARWLETTDGQRAWDWIESTALCRAATNPKRIGAKKLVEDCRDVLHVSIDNTWTGLFARKLVDEYPVLKPYIELRERAA